MFLYCWYFISKSSFILLKWRPLSKRWVVANLLLLACTKGCQSYNSGLFDIFIKVSIAYFTFSSCFTFSSNLPFSIFNLLFLLETLLKWFLRVLRSRCEKLFLVFLRHRCEYFFFLMLLRFCFKAVFSKTIYFHFS